MTRFKVMLVDDEPDVRKIVRLCLEALGRWAVVVAGSGSEALTLASCERPDLIILDAMMPDMEGPALLSELRQRPECAATPVIFLTARTDQVYLDRLSSLDALGVIPKPFDPLALPGEVRRLLASSKGAERHG